MPVFLLQQLGTEKDGEMWPCWMCSRWLFMETSPAASGFWPTHGYPETGPCITPICGALHASGQIDPVTADT